MFECRAYDVVPEMRSLLDIFDDLIRLLRRAGANGATTIALASVIILTPAAQAASAVVITICHVLFDILERVGCFQQGSFDVVL